MYQDSKRTCTTIVLLIKPFVWWRSRCRRRRGFVNSLLITSGHWVKLVRLRFRVLTQLILVMIQGLISCLCGANSDIKVKSKEIHESSKPHKFSKKVKERETLRFGQ